MDYQKDYVQKLNFKEYEKTNALAYELIMRNEECQKCFKKLHRIIKKSYEVQQRGKPLLDIYDKNEELRNYVDKRWEMDQVLSSYSSLQNTLLKQLLNYFLILKGTYEEEEYAGYFINYVDKKQKELQDGNGHINYSQVIHSIQNMIQLFIEEAYRKDANLDRAEINFKIKNILETLIQSIGYKIMSRKYDYVVGFATSEEKQIVAEMFQTHIDTTLAAIGVASDLGVDKLLREIKYIIDEDMETYYMNYRKYVRDIMRLERLRHTTEDYMSYEFYIDFQQELYLNYSFYSLKLQKDLHEFYQKVKQKSYSELEIPHHVNMRKKEVISHDDFSLELETFFSIDTKLINQLNSIQLAENMLQLMKQNPNEFIFRSTFVKPSYARPSLFSERFREITLTFNPNLSKKELKLQFETIIDLYQSDKLKNRSIYETVGEEFGKWSKKIERPKRNYSSKTKEQNYAAKDILTILNNIADLLYIYDSHKQGSNHTEKTYPTNMSESSISSYLNMAQFLIDEQGYKILLTSHK